MNLQPTLKDEIVTLHPLRNQDFAMLFAVASDPLIWEQHPTPTRYQRAEFEKYFRGAIDSGGAFLIRESKKQAVIGSTRFYDLNLDAEAGQRSVFVGFTFLARSHWGGSTNQHVKALLLKHAFQSVDRVLFHVGAENRRSQIAMERLGAVNVRTFERAFAGEPATKNVEYMIERAAWQSRVRASP